MPRPQCTALFRLLLCDAMDTAARDRDILDIDGGNLAIGKCLSNRRLGRFVGLGAVARKDYAAIRDVEIDKRAAVPVT